MVNSQKERKAQGNARAAIRQVELSSTPWLRYVEQRDRTSIIGNTGYSAKRKDSMPENPNQPREYDAVLGGEAPPPLSGAVLGGVEGLRRAF